jgi:hypothetical protein
MNHYEEDRNASYVTAFRLSSRQMPQDSSNPQKAPSRQKPLTSLLQSRQNATPIPPGMQEKMAAVCFHFNPYPPNFIFLVCKCKTGQCSAARRNHCCSPAHLAQWSYRTPQSPARQLLSGSSSKRWWYDGPSQAKFHPQGHRRCRRRIRGRSGCRTAVAAQERYRSCLFKFLQDRVCRLSVVQPLSPHHRTEICPAPSILAAKPSYMPMVSTFPMAHLSK